MAGTSLLALIDDIATLLDDVSVMTKVAAKKTAGVLGDDLALNAQQVTGVKADRELPVVWAVAKGSMMNKAILVPAALLISAFVPWLIVPLLLLGGAFLCFEGAEKLVHRFLHRPDEEEAQHQALIEPRLAAADRPVLGGAGIEPPGRERQQMQRPAAQLQIERLQQLPQLLAALHRPIHDRSDAALPQLAQAQPDRTHAL